MKKIIALTDYKDRFGSKHFDNPYRSGMDKNLLKKHFNDLGFTVEFIQFTEMLNNTAIDKEAYYIFTSSEDINYYYKSFIEDVVLFLETQGCKMLPSYKYLRANNNKVFMELLRNATKSEDILSIRSKVFGTYEEAMHETEKIVFPVVIKTAEGACGKGVFKASTIAEYKKIVKNISATKDIYYDTKDILRKYKHKGYLKESSFRKKFVVQNMITDLKNDWKVYYFFNKFYLFYRPIIANRGFRASGGGYDNYIYAENAPRPEGLLDFVKKVASSFDVPNASIDIAFDGSQFHLIEIQFLYFGTAGIPYSKGYFENKNNKWDFISKEKTIESVYAESIAGYIQYQDIL